MQEGSINPPGLKGEGIMVCVGRPPPPMVLEVCEMAKRGFSSQGWQGFQSSAHLLVAINASLEGGDGGDPC